MRSNRRAIQRKVIKKAKGAAQHIPHELRVRFGHWLKEQRDNAELTQQELGEAVGLSPGSAGNTISAIENGRANLQPERYAAFCTALGITEDELAAAVLRHTDPWVFKVAYKSQDAELLREIAQIAQL